MKYNRKELMEQWNNLEERERVIHAMRKTSLFLSYAAYVLADAFIQDQIEQQEPQQHLSLIDQLKRSNIDRKENPKSQKNATTSIELRDFLKSRK